MTYKLYNGYFAGLWPILMRGESYLSLKGGSIEEFLDCDKFTLYIQGGEKVLISINEPGYEISKFDRDILKKYPRIKVTNFIMLRDAIRDTMIQPVEIGVLRPKIEVVISADKMEAQVRINVTDAEFEATKDKLEVELIQALKENGVTNGICYDVIKGDLKPRENIVIARGIPPKNGENAKIKYIDLSNRKPVVRQDGKVDYYELNLIQQVEKGNWVGEKRPATPGEAGKTVTDQILPPKPGKDQLLRYDSNTISENMEDGQIVLRALIDGAVSFENGKIKILNHLIIDGDVDYDTGNITFNGYVTINGIVCDGFSVKAEKDISIHGNIGIGAAKEIVSIHGDIYIKGGISGKGRAILKAGKNVFVKYINDCTVIAGQDINIGLYAMDADLHAQSIIVNSSKGKIIGGSLNAQSKVSAYTIGNISERRTFVNVKGFNRPAIKKELDELLLQYKEHLIELEKNRRQMKIYENKLKMNQKKVHGREYEAYKKIDADLLAKISTLEEKRKALMDVLSSRGEGEVNIFKKAYPQTFLEIKNIQKRISKVTQGTYFAMDNELHFS